MAARPAEGKLLESWKEISTYLKRSERTCRRWEETLRLPIHRLDGTPNARVFAYAGELDHWLAEKLHHLDNCADEEDLGARPGPWRRRFLAVSGVAAVGLIVLGAVLFWPSPPPPSPAVKPSVAILPFANETGLVSLDPWRTAFPDLVVVDLGQSRYANVVRITDLQRALVELKLNDKFVFSSADLETVAAKVGADHIVTGRLVGSESDHALVASVHNAGVHATAPPKEIRVPFNDGPQAFTAADQLSRRIRASLDLTPAQVSRDLDRAVRRISTPSSVAFRLFSQGYRLVGIADFQSGIPLLRKAAEEDPQFALAYKVLFRCSESLNLEDEARKYAEQAFRLADRMSEREKDDFLFFFHSLYTNNEAKKTEALERLCRFYPDDRFGSLQLLSRYADQNDWARGLPIAEQAWKAHQSDSTLNSKLALYYENMGRAEEAERLLTRFIDGNPRHDNLDMALLHRAYLHIRMGREEAARADIDRMDAIYPNHLPNDLFRAAIFLREGDVDEAERIFLKESGAGEPGRRIEAFLELSDVNLMKGRIEQAAQELRCGLEIIGRLPQVDEDFKLLTQKVFLHGELAYLYRRSGRLKDANEEIDTALQASTTCRDLPHPPSEFWRLKGLLLVDLGQDQAFAELAEDVRRASAKDRQLASVYDHLLGYKELFAGRIVKAISYLSRAVEDLNSIQSPDSVGPNPAPYYDLAQACARDPNDYAPASVIAIYEKVIAPWVDRNSAGDLYALSLYQIGRQLDSALFDPYTRAWEKPGFRDRAIAHYRKFLGLWGTADPLFTGIVAEARRRLAALEAAAPSSKALSVAR